jgi:anti-sigma factor RsiW
VKTKCPRSFEVEALRDGRLTGSELSRFELHLASCSACTREAQALQSLAAALRSSAASAEADELHVRRERTRLLAAFDASRVAAPGLRAKPWLLATAATLISAVATLALIIGAAPTAPPAAPQLAAPVAAHVLANSSANWSRRVDDQRETITLQSGALSIHVGHASAQRRLLVILPDGELEDIGTTFSVSVDGGRTTRISVQEGSVILRLHGSPAIVLAAGDSWTPPPALVVTPLASASAAPRPSQSTRERPVRAAAPPPSARDQPESEAPADPSADFRQAMSALGAGQNARAASLFDAFAAKHPADARAEDAAYLRVLALERSGNRAAAEQAAQSYLRRYPSGFRRAEVEALAR